MSWLRFFTHWFLSFLVAWIPYASNAAAGRDSEGALRSDYQNAKRVQTISHRVVVNQGGSQVIPLQAGTPTVRFMTTPTAQLEKFVPTRMNAEMLAEMQKARSNPHSFGAITKRFPVEASMFFISIGAVVALQLFTNYSANPVAMKQHVDHQLSPIGMFSFLMFMYANGATSHALSVWIKNPSFAGYIPYLGMTAGFFVQSTISSFAADPNVKMCIGKLLGKKPSASQLQQEKLVRDEADAQRFVRDARPGRKLNPCDEAFNWYTTKQRFAQLTPGLLSMLASTFASGMLQKAVTARALAWTGVDIGMWFVPGGGFFKGMRFVVATGTQMGLFYYIDAQILNRPITFVWHNWTDGIALTNQQNKLVKLIEAKKSVGWANKLTAKSCTTLQRNYSCEEDLTWTLKETQRMMRDWRMMNMAKVQESHYAWQEKLHQLNGRYDLTHQYYSDFVSEARSLKYGDASISRLNITYPFIGVVPANLQEKNMLYLDPAYVVDDQGAKVREAGVWLKKRLTTVKKGSMGCVPFDDPNFQIIANGLTSTNVNVQGRALVLLAKEEHHHKQKGDCQSRRAFPELRAKLGVITPKMEPGRGFGAVYELYSDASTKLKEVRFPKYKFINVKTPLVTDYMNMQMLCGPDLRQNQSVIGNVFMGYPYNFQAPSITPLSNKASICRNGFGIQTTADGLYDTPINVAGKKSNSAFNYLKTNIRAEILGPRELPNDKDGFPRDFFTEWWRNKTDGQMKKSYDMFSLQYEKIVAMLVEKLNTGDSRFNGGPVANGAIDAIRQQYRLNLVVLGELLKDSYLRQHPGQRLPRSIFMNHRETTPTAHAGYRAPQPTFLGGFSMNPTKQTFPLIAALRQSTAQNGRQPIAHATTFEWARLVKAYPATEEGRKNRPTLNYPVAFQKLIEIDIERMLWRLKQIKVVTVNGRTRISSKLENSDLEKDLENLQNKLVMAADQLGVGVSKKAGLVNFNKEKENHELAKATLEDLQALGFEISLYGSMANAVSWEKMQRLNQNGSAQAAFVKQIQAAAKQAMAVRARQ